MAKTLVMNFLNEEGKKTAIRVNNIREDITDLEVSTAMDVIIQKNIFSSTGGDLKFKDSASITDRTSSELSIK